MRSHRKREGGRCHQHGGNRRRALPEAVAHGEQAGRGHSGHLIDDKARGIEPDPAERAADNQRNTVPQGVSDDLAIDRPEAAAMADLRQNNERGDQLCDRIARQRPFGGLTEQLDQHQADDETHRRPENLLDRIDPDLVAGPGRVRRYRD